MSNVRSSLKSFDTAYPKAKGGHKGPWQRLYECTKAKARSHKGGIKAGIKLKCVSYEESNLKSTRVKNSPDNMVYRGGTYVNIQAYNKALRLKRRNNKGKRSND